MVGEGTKVEWQCIFSPEIQNDEIDKETKKGRDKKFLDEKQNL